jgi:hypothetical protein
MPDFSDLLSAEPTEDLQDDPNLDLTDDTEPIDEDSTVSDDGSGDEPEPEATDEPGDEPAPEEDVLPAIGDGKTIPADLKALMQANPGQAKMLKALYFTNARYNKFGSVADLQKLKDFVGSYGSLDDAIRTKETIDSVGDLNELVASHREYEALDQQFTSGDPAYVEHLAQANPEAFGKIAPSFLQRFGADHPEQYNYLMSQVVMSTLINSGTINDLSLLQQAAATGNVEQMKQIAARVVEQVGVLNGLSQRAPKVAAADPRVAQLEKERQQLKQQQQQTFVNDIKDRTNTWIAPEITKALVPYGKAVTPALAKRLDAAIKEELGALLSSNERFQSKLKQTLSRGDRDGALKLYRDSVAPLLSTTARKVGAEFGLKLPPKKAAPLAQSGLQQPGRRAAAPKIDVGFEKVTAYPNVKDVKRDFPEYYDMAAKNQFLLKNGRKIQVVG